MKFGQKIFLMSFLLIIITINVIGIIMINYTYRSNIQKEIDKSLLQTNNIIVSMKENIENLPYISNVYFKSNMNVEMYIYGKRFYSNFNTEDSEIGSTLLTKEDYFDQQESDFNFDELYEQPTSSEPEYITSYIKGDKLFAKIRSYPYVLITLSDISEVNNMKQEQIEFFIKLSLASSFLIALALSISVNFLTKKIKILNNTVEQVKNGNYSMKIKRLGNDEIGNFSKSFNKMTEAIEKNISEIKQVSENRKRFIGNLTHEIRTPLTSIIGYSSLIKNRKITDTQTILDYTDKIYEEGKYIDLISERLMDIFLLENGCIKLEEINLSTELIKIIDDVKSIFPNVTYETNITENVFVQADRALFKSLILNLIKNAISSYDTHAIVKVCLNNNKELYIIDYGRGIPKKDLERIKEPFYTLSMDRNRKLSGMGLGLPLCIKIAEVHKWILEIQSTENIGTKIKILLGENNEK